VRRNAREAQERSILVTEGCRGDGGLLKDGDGHRFMPDYAPPRYALDRPVSNR
jgi:succinate dehydrogenase/fumarate reductase flavoprotein subunit